MSDNTHIRDMEERFSSDISKIYVCGVPLTELTKDQLMSLVVKLNNDELAQYRKHQAQAQVLSELRGSGKKG